MKPQSSKINPGAKPQNLVSPHRPSFLCDCGDTICPSSCCFYCKRPFPQNKQYWRTPCMIASSGCLCTISFPQNKQTLLNVFSWLLLLQRSFPQNKQTVMVHPEFPGTHFNVEWNCAPRILCSPHSGRLQLFLIPELQREYDKGLTEVDF